MLTPELSNQDLLPPTLYNPHAQPIPIVRRLELDDPILAHFLDDRQISFLDTLIPLPFGFENEPFEAGIAQHATTSWIFGALQDIARTIPDPMIRERYEASDMSLAELLTVLQYASPELRYTFVERLVQRMEQDAEAREFILDKLDNALDFLSLEQKSTLVFTLLPGTNSEVSAAAILAVFYSCNTLDELSRLVDLVGTQELLCYANGDIRECIALATLGSAVRGIPFSEEMSREALEASLGAVIALCEGSNGLADTQVARDFLATAQEDLFELARELEAQQCDPAQCAEVVRIAAASAALEFRFGVNISRGESELLSDKNEGAVDIFEDPDLIGWLWQRAAETTKKGWALHDIHDIQTVLESIPEGHLLSTRMLRQIEFVDDLGWGVLGARYHSDGKIKIAALAIGHKGLEAQYNGVSSLVIVLAHEIGHGLQIGAGPAGFNFDSPAAPQFGLGERNIDFDEWCALSGWEVFSRERFHAGTTPGTVVVDGQELPVDEPVVFKGKRIILSFNPYAEILMKYDADAKFSSRDYSRASPWEDFAEAFAEYLFLPERLFQDAPKKFAHLEREFGRYRQDARFCKAPALLDTDVSPNVRS